MSRSEERARRGAAPDVREKTSLRDRIGRVFGIPADAVGISNGFMAEMRGRSGVSLRGCRKILAYSDHGIRVLTKDGEITVAGSGLRCIAYFRDAIGIEGRIDGVFFEDCRETLSRCVNPCAPAAGGADDGTK